MIGIYKIQNQINEKVYIGQSVDIDRRWREHQTRPFRDINKDTNIILYKAIQKYGLESFSFSVLEQCSQAMLDERERYWINYYHSSDLSFGYNMTEGGQNKTVTHSKITKQQVEEIIKLLKDSLLSEAEIAEQYGINQKSVSNINIGATWYNEQEQYPLRELQRHQLVKKEKIKANEYYNQCALCGKIISKRATYCIDCGHKAARVVVHPSRQELKLMIRTESFVAISKKYQVSDKAISKWCKNENLPYRKSDIKKYSDEEWEKI